ncbi:alpha/beta hydrolase [Silvanigrella sp.]|jgi:pimeloyl-ACP methyl ester carboxylesterase|uniref:alpha/beta hydrolase n=1 Tax=Silvanigrella sp. TaxID=2024976 RepID=UPI0037CAFBC8
MKTKTLIINDLYVAMHTPKNWNGHCVFYVHGGPGSHSKDFEEGLTYFNAFYESQLAFITYDQRGSGRSKIKDHEIKNLNHRGNIEDLKNLIMATQEVFNLKLPPVLYGHSYGARLVYDFLWNNPKIDLKFILSGTSLHPNDCLNTSLGLDLLVLRKSQPEEFKKAVELISSASIEPYEISPEIRKLFSDLKMRQKERQKYYWVNEVAMNWWNKIDSEHNVKDSDEAYFKIVSSFNDETFNSGSFNPCLLKQKSLYINGFHDYLMNGTIKFSIEDQSKIIRFNASAHYPHFEEPELFMKTVLKFILDDN